MNVFSTELLLCKDTEPKELERILCLLEHKLHREVTVRDVLLPHLCGRNTGIMVRMI